MSEWVSLLQSIAVIGILVVALGLIIGTVQPGEAGKRIGAILGITVALVLIPRPVIDAWDELAAWKRVGLVIVVFTFWKLRSGRRQSPRNRRE